MPLFDALVNEALRNQTELNPLRNVVEKEILHHDILRELAQANLLQDLTFIGGTCLRACYSSNRLSEDLDFTGGTDFTKDQLQALKETLEDRLRQKYEIPISITEPKAEKQGNVDTWKLRVITQPERRDMPAQRIHIDICAVPSYQIVPLTLRNHYSVDLGTEGMIINAQSREEIFSDKLIAFGMRPGRLKYRDLWDITWLAQRGVNPALELIEDKLADHGESVEVFLQQSETRLASLGDEEHQRDFRFEMARFIPPTRLEQTISQKGFWTYLTSTVAEHIRTAQERLDNPPTPGGGSSFLM